MWCLCRSVLVIADETEQKTETNGNQDYESDNCFICGAH